MKFRAVALAACAVLAILLSHCKIAGSSDGLREIETRVQSIPITVFSPSEAAPAPVVVIAHGFAGSQQLMQPIATTLARNGYIAVTFDFAGHGRNPLPLVGGIVDMDKSAKTLLAEIDAVVAYARALPGSDGRVALVGHSMAADLVVAYAMAHPDIAATAALSWFGRDVTATNPKISSSSTAPGSPRC